LQEETRRHLDYLDGWRGLAIATVLLGHFWLDTIRPGVSVLGVDLFFVLSGRLMAEILFVRQAHLPTFFARRFSRVYPGIFCFVVIASLAFAATPYVHGPLAAISALTFTLNYAMIYAHPVALLDHLWSLCVEEHAYIILAGVALLARRRLWNPPLIMLLLGGFALANGILRIAVLHQPYFDVFWRSDVQVAPIFISAGFFLLLGKRRVNPWIAPLALALGVAAKLSGGHVALHFGLGTLLLALAVATLDSSLPALRRIFEALPLRSLGIWSFSIYLWQQPFYKLSHHGTLSILMALLAALGAGLASFYLIERPARAWLNRRWPPAFERVQAGLQARGLWRQAK
jgi:peptidoglycan/LPS O-acetylase OafA/YrhL